MSNIPWAPLARPGPPPPALAPAPFFLAPPACGRRVAILYGGGIFACRRCYRLAYASSRENAGGRATRRADRLRARLAWEPGILNGEGGKPKWMRWRTFERLGGGGGGRGGGVLGGVKFGLLGVCGGVVWGCGGGGQGT